MAINISIYSNSNNRTQTVTVDFAAEMLAASLSGTSNELQYFFKFTTSARDTNNITLPVKIVQSLSDLALINASNVSLQRYRSATNSIVAYEDINTMVVDYIYDYAEGHIADKWTGVSGNAVQLPMKFTS